MFKYLLYNMIRKRQAIPAGGFAPASGEPSVLADTLQRLDGIFKRSIRIRQVDAGSCNACEWECTALTNPVYDIQRFGVDFVASPRHADILLVTGPVTLGMAEALKKTYDATPGPKIVIACGDCAKDGGMYRGSYAVLDGVQSVLPVDGYIPGCPPSPSRILAGVLELLELLTKHLP